MSTYYAKKKIELFEAKLEEAKNDTEAMHKGPVRDSLVIVNKMMDDLLLILKELADG